MSTHIFSLLEAQGGVASCHQLIEVGHSRRTIEALVRRGELVRVRQDAVVLATVLRTATPWERQTLTARAVGASMAPAPGPPTAGRAAGKEYALSHESALMIHGLPHYGGDGMVHLVRTDGGRGRRDRTVWVHRPVENRWVVEVEGLRVVTPSLAALQVAATHGHEAGLVAVDGVLHRAEVQDHEEVGRRNGPAVATVRAEFGALIGTGFGPGTSTAALVAELGDGRSESAGESRSRWLVRTLGLGPCTPQFSVYDGPDPVGVADLKLDRWRVLIEFDGTGKYTGPDSLLAEKDREDRIRALGYEVVRLRWSDLARPHLVRQKLLAAIARAEARAATPA